jgi:zinc/manganese transport system substrate-binding protein
MSKFYIISLLAITFTLLPISSQAKINVFACEPEWRSLADEIGSDHIKSYSATSAKQDPHHIRAKPSLIAKIRKSDLLICSGADLEIGWLPILLQKANSNIQIGKVGHLMASNFVHTIEKPKIIDRSMGDIHVQGNPHIHLNPYNILLVAKELTSRLKTIDPINSRDYQNNYNKFVEKLSKSIKAWERKALKLQGIKIVVHHQSFSYLFNWLKLNVVATLESKPGIAPTASHLKNILVSVSGEPVKLIITTPYDPKDASSWLSNTTGVKELVLPFTVSDDEGSNNLFMLFEQTINLMIEAI